MLTGIAKWKDESQVNGLKAFPYRHPISRASKLFEMTLPQSKMPRVRKRLLPVSGKLPARVFWQLILWNTCQHWGPTGGKPWGTHKHHPRVHGGARVSWYLQWKKGTVGLPSARDPEPGLVLLWLGRELSNSTNPFLLGNWALTAVANEFGNYFPATETIFSATEKCLFTQPIAWLL